MGRTLPPRPNVDHAVVAALYQFRMATAEQLRVLHTPPTASRS
ncbi:hypothetical protein [Kitasatospora sp. NPDC050463]